MSIEIGIILTVCSVVIAVLGYQLNKKNQEVTLRQNAEQNAKKEGKMEGTLEHISRGVDEIKVDVKSNRDQLNEVRREVTAAREKADSAHKRIDELVKK